MTDKKSDLNREFSRAHDHAPKLTKHQAKVPEMIRRDKPLYKPKPPVLGRQVDAEIFDQRWGREMLSRGQSERVDVNRHQQLRQNAQVIKNSGLKLSDKFERIERRAREQKRDRSRGR